jgi:hypothetical protein
MFGAGPPQCAIIRAVHERRQRRQPGPTRAIATGVSIVAVLALNGGCEARSSIEGAQTAVAVAQTALPGLQTALPELQTALPGVQATAQAGATVVSGVLSDPQVINVQLQMLLAGANVDLKTLPRGVANDLVTQVTIDATDTYGSFAQLDARARQAAAGGAILLAAQYYPTAIVSLTVADSDGALLQAGSKAPGQTPSLQ